MPSICRRLSTKAEAYLQERKDGVVQLVLDRPEVKNALSRKLVGELAGCLGELHGPDHQKTCVVVLHSTDGAFCAGADLKERKGMTLAEVDAFLLSLRQVCQLLESLSMPTIAAIDGVALGGGLELALCTDLIVVGKGAKMALPETRLGIMPGAGGTQRLTRLVGAARAKELIFTGKTFDSVFAHRVGIAQICAPRAIDGAFELADQIAQNAPLAVRAAKRAINYAAASSALDHGLDFERAAYQTLLDTLDRQEGLTAFAEKRRPRYTGQ